MKAMETETSHIRDSAPQLNTVRVRNFRSRLLGLGISLLVVVVLFSVPLWKLVTFAASSNLHSHILLIPFISGYLIWMRRKELFPGRETESHTHPSPVLRTPSSQPDEQTARAEVGERDPSAADARAHGSRGLVPMTSFGPALVCLLICGALLVTYGIAGGAGAELALNDRLSLMTAAFLAVAVGLGFLFLGTPVLGLFLFPVAFLIFMVPMPTFFIEGLQKGLQYGSAEASYWVLHLSGTPILREGLVFHMPGLSVEVAEECSGIRSTVVLFITSVLAGQFFLKGGWHRALIALMIIPLGIFRNALRIGTISLLTVYVDPGVIHGPIHKSGGPPFFVLSLIPLFLVMFWFRRRERKSDE